MTDSTKKRSALNFFSDLVVMVGSSTVIIFLIFLLDIFPDQSEKFGILNTQLKFVMIFLLGLGIGVTAISMKAHSIILDIPSDEVSD